jgi:hypothetical protein
VKYRLTELAAEQADAEDLWWREHRDKAPGLFTEELDRMIETILLAPEGVPLFGVIDRTPMRRVQLKKTRCHLYYSVELDELVIHYVWGARLRDLPGRGGKKSSLT